MLSSMNLGKKHLRSSTSRLAAFAYYSVLSSSSILPPAHCFSTTFPTTTQASRPFGVIHHHPNTKFAASQLTDVRGGDSSSSIRKMSSTTTSSMTTNDDKTEATTTLPSSAGDKLTKLRSLMKSHNVHAYIVPPDDPHLSEYVSAAYARRAHISEFDGSAGTALIGLDGAWLWTDGRYYNQAGTQLDGNHWELMKGGLVDTPSIPKFLAGLASEFYKDGGEVFQIGLDPYVHSASFAEDVETALKDAASDFQDMEDMGEDDEEGSKGDFKLGELNTLDGQDNLVDTVWGEDRPQIPRSKFRVHPLEYAGMSIADKITKIREEMEEQHATLCIFPALDDVAYLLNMRATGDVDCNPVGIAYCTVSKDKTTLYCDAEHKINSEPSVISHLEEGGVTIAPYENIVEDIEQHIQGLRRDGSKSKKSKAKIWVDKSRCNYAIVRVIGKSNLLDKQNPVTPMKACKNEAELEGMRRAHIVDGVAMAQFMSWLEDKICNQRGSVSEVEIDRVLTGYRAKQPGFIEVSFPTIAGVGSNGAIIHYSAKEGDLMQCLDATKPILIDSGGQYLYGTTDVTRTWHFGGEDVITDEYKDLYTRVLKGNIGVDSMVFPENTPGFVLDVMARKSLWDDRKDYGHGTGHGVGAALNVHEGPFSISSRWGNKEVLKASMIVSNEPGYYRNGQFGIRIENLLEIVKMEKDEEEEGGKQFFAFEKLTLIPIQKNLINVKLLTDAELDWLNAYHAEVLEKVGPLLEDGDPGKEWLRKGCEKIER